MLYGVVERERATAGILATTSVFTVGAQEETAGELAYRLRLRDAKDIAGWIREGHELDSPRPPGV